MVLKKAIRVIKIDSTQKRVYEDYIPAERTLDSLQEAVSGVVEGEKIAGLITIAVKFEHGDSLYVHDEGLYHFKEGFTVNGINQAFFAGNGIITGTDDEGEIVSTKMSLEEVESFVDFKYEADPESHAKCEVTAFTTVEELLAAREATQRGPATPR